jgi:hypothetical protein
MKVNTIDHALIKYLEESTSDLVETGSSGGEIYRRSDQAMSKRAYHLNGEPFELPPNIAGWRVRKRKLKGAPELVLGHDGLPLYLPLDADIEEVSRREPNPGRYRIDHAFIEHLEESTSDLVETGSSEGSSDVGTSV